ncbi:phBC6A51 family helix-turn-helix protein [Cytobacillus oceanisediminis]|uniref:phBC6A51 family helix-turn-helix protein n=1 Tax=Cytobacillus oceanisediminis TaxID=665099 RepID=UPI003735233B
MSNQSQNVTNNGLKPEQVNMARVLADPSETGTIVDLCEKHGVNRRTFYRWMEKKEFVDYVNSLIDQYTDAELAGVWKALALKARSGDTHAIKLFFEMKGKYREVKELKHTGFTLESIIDMFNNGEMK